MNVNVNALTSEDQIELAYDPLEYVIYITGSDKFQILLDQLGYEYQTEFISNLSPYEVVQQYRKVCENEFVYIYEWDKLCEFMEDRIPDNYYTTRY